MYSPVHSAGHRLVRSNLAYAVFITWLSFSLERARTTEKIWLSARPIIISARPIIGTSNYRPTFSDHSCVAYLTVNRTLSVYKALVLLLVCICNDQWLWQLWYLTHSILEYFSWAASRSGVLNIEEQYELRWVWLLRFSWQKQSKHR